MFSFLHDNFIATNHSKWPQEARGEEEIEANSIVVIMQTFEPLPQEERYIGWKEMLETVLASRGARSVYIKPHPRQSMQEAEEIVAYHDPENGVFVTAASIHDLLDAADLVVTQASVVAFEAYMHKTPSIVGGHVDFHHCLVTVKKAEEIPKAIEEALKLQIPYEKYLYWFLKMNMIEGKKADCLLQMLEILREKGIEI